MSVRISSVKFPEGTIDGDITYLHFHNLGMELNGREIFFSPLHSCDSAHKTFGPTDLTSSDPVCTWRVFGGIEPRPSGLESDALTTRLPMASSLTFFFPHALVRRPILPPATSGEMGNLRTCTLLQPYHSAPNFPIRLITPLAWIIVLPVTTIIAIFTDKTWFVTPCSILICNPYAAYNHPSEFAGRIRPHPVNVNAAENRVWLRIEGKTFVRREKLSFHLFQKEQFNLPSWSLASMTYPIPQIIS
ncbi:hypothetical protein TNCV_411751 [Trichonephila clavipes]|nr:hypothetical protein TNCV_411751 [Trichonephila clavipes]